MPPETRTDAKTRSTLPEPIPERLPSPAIDRAEPTVAEDPGERMLRAAGPFLGLASVGAIGILIWTFVGQRGPAPTPAPAPSYELVATCKAPFLRRNAEQLMRRNDGKLFYKDAHGVITPVADDADPDQVCRNVGKAFWK